MGADTATEISARPISQEPMVSDRYGSSVWTTDMICALQYLIMNLGQSTNFGKVDTEHIPYPVTMSVDYIRVYQPKDAINYGCSPPDFPTADYINQ